VGHPESNACGDISRRWTLSPRTYRYHHRESPSFREARMSMPDSHSIRRRVQTRFGLESDSSFDLLCEIGRDCIGALQLGHSIAPASPEIHAEPLNEAAIASLLRNYHSAPLGMAKKLDFRISLAGAQEKTALLWHDHQWKYPLASTPTSHILKLPIGRIQHSGIDLSTSLENEWLSLKILSAFGLPVSQAEILQFEDIKVLAVKRFDRRWVNNDQFLMRLPQEDLCQALGLISSLKYESDGGQELFR